MIFGREFCLVRDCLFFLKDNIKGDLEEFIIFMWVLMFFKKKYIK